MLLVDTVEFNYSLPELVEAEGQQWLEVEGRVQHADLQNANGRVYPRGLWEKILADPHIVENLNQGAMLGELDHPDDGKTSLKRVSHIVRKVWMKESGEVMGRIRILNNDQGRQLQEIIRAGGKVGISSRGSGSVKPVNGAQVVQEDFKLNTWDFVTTPSTPNAYPKPVNVKEVYGKNEETTKEEEVPVQEDCMDAVKKLTSLRKSLNELTEGVDTAITTKQREQIVNELIGIEVELNKLTEDKAAAPIATELRDQATALRKGLAEKKGEDKKDGDDDEDDKEKKSDKDSDGDKDDKDDYVGDKDAPKKQKFMKGNVVGEASGEVTSNEGEQMSETNIEEQIATLTKQRDTAIRQARITYRMAEADRSAQSLIVNALRNRLKEILASTQVAPAPVVSESNEKDTEINRLKEENQKLSERNARLESLVTKIQEKMTTPDATVAESVIAKPKATTSEPLPETGATSNLVVESKTVTKGAGASLAARAVSLMRKTSNSKIERGGQLLEGKSGVR